MGDGEAAVTILNELEGFWRAAGQKEKSYAAAERALGLLRNLDREETIEYATTLLNYATAMMVFGDTQDALAIYRHVGGSTSRSCRPATTATRASTTTWPRRCCGPATP